MIRKFFGRVSAVRSLVIVIAALATLALQAFDTPYLTFRSPNSFSISATKRWNGTIEYSTDTVNWTTWTGAEISAEQSGAEYFLYMRGSGNTTISATSSTASGAWKLTGSNISCEGDIETLREYSGTPSTMGAYCYQQMFMGQTALVKAPTLSATTLANACYAYMFQGTSITTAPELPAMSLPTYCYQQMFCNCTSLTAAPDLPATTINTGCYISMFNGCSALVSAPSELPATTLYSSCYNQMFKGCAITEAPTLPAMTMVSQCYYGMFENCTSLTKAPALPATTLYGSCYYGMFRGCSSLLVAPELPATTMTSQCYYQMFKNCTSLVQAPALPATSLITDCYYQMFMGCTGLKMIPSLPATTSKYRCYYQMFKDCSSLKISRFSPGVEWLLPPGFSTASNAISGMFTGTGGSFTSDPTPGTSYYIQSVPETPVEPLVQTSANVATMVGESANIALSSSLSGGTPPYNVSLKSGSTLPDGLTMSQYGVITGTPSTAGSYPFTVTVTDSASTPQEKEFEFTLKVNGIFTITYRESDDSKNVYPLPVIYSYREGEGVPTLPVPSKTAYTFLCWYDAPAPGGNLVSSITASDSGDKTLYARWEPVNYSITYIDGEDGTTELTGLAPTTYTIESGATLPTSASKEGYMLLGWYVDKWFNGSSVIAISAGTYGDKTFYAKWFELGKPLALDDGELIVDAGEEFILNLKDTITGGTVAYSFALKEEAGNALPDGLTLDTDGTLYGTVASAGNYEFKVIVTDSTEPVANVIEATYTLEVDLTKTTTDPLGTDATLLIGFPEEINLATAISGGKKPYSFELAEGALPAGMVLNGTKLEGTPTMVGNSHFVLNVTDDNGFSTPLDYWIYCQSNTAQNHYSINGINWGWVSATPPKQDGRISIWDGGTNAIPVSTVGTVYVPAHIGNISDDVTCIGSGAFSNCTAITRVMLPDTVIDIGENAFYGCTALTSLVIRYNVEHINTNAFSGCSSLAVVYVDQGDVNRVRGLFEASGCDVSGIAFVECVFYTLTLDVNLGDEFEMPVLTKPYTESSYLPTVGNLPVPTRYNYTFDGWYTKDGIRIEEDQKLAGGDWTLYAHWTTTLPDPVFTVNWKGELTDVDVNDHTEIVVPETVNDITVTAIGYRAFDGLRVSANKRLLRVTLPGTIKNIDSRAFAECIRLREINIPEGVTNISQTAFNYCGSLQAVNIPGSVETIGLSAFANCSNLVSVTIGNGVNSIGQYAFGNCTSLACDDEQGFYIPDSVESIGSGAFHGVAFTKASLPGSLYSVGSPVSAAFSNVNLLKAVDVIYRTDQPTFVIRGGILTRVYLNEHAEVVIPDGVTDIWAGAFNGLSAMTSVTIPGTVTNIHIGAFTDCSGLTEIDIPDSVVTLGRAFAGCTNLKSLVIPDSVTELEDGCFGLYDFLESVTIGSGVTVIPFSAFSHCSSLTNVTIRGNVTTIERVAFTDCSSLLAIELPDTLKEIGTMAFYNCASLESVKIPKGVEIGTFAFAHCSSLAGVNIGGTLVPKMMMSAGKGARLLAAASDPDDTTVGSYAFYGCNELESALIGSKVSEIGGGAFGGCPKLKSITVEAGNENYKTDGGMLLTADGKVLISGAGDATDITVPNGVTNILEGAFAGFTAITNVTLPNTVQVVGEAAFSNATALATMTIPNSVAAIGANAFCDTVLATVNVEAGQTETVKALVEGTGYDGVVAYVEPSAPASKPSIDGDPSAEVTGDETSGYTIKPSTTEGTVEVTIPSGLSPEKVTVEVPPTASVKPNGANVKVVKTVDETPYDITEFLDIPAPNASGVVDLSQATVKEAIVKEVLDPTAEGVDIDLADTDDPSITTAATRPGLTYTLWEGTTLEGMAASTDPEGTKVGDGTSWTPPISVKGGTSGFYSIGVSK